MTYYMIMNFITGATDFVTTKAEANLIVESNKLALLEREGYRFTVTRIIVEGDNVTYASSDLEQDPDNGQYQVFNTITNEHEEFVSKIAAWARLQEIRDEFLSQYFAVPWKEVPKEYYQHMTAPQRGQIPVTQL